MSQNEPMDQGGARRAATYLVVAVIVLVIIYFAATQYWGQLGNAPAPQLPAASETAPAPSAPAPIERTRREAPVPAKPALALNVTG